MIVAKRTTLRATPKNANEKSSLNGAVNKAQHHDGFGNVVPALNANIKLQMPTSWNPERHTTLNSSGVIPLLLIISRPNIRV